MKLLKTAWEIKYPGLNIVTSLLIALGEIFIGLGALVISVIVYIESQRSPSIKADIGNLFAFALADNTPIQIMTKDGEIYLGPPRIERFYGFDTQFLRDRKSNQFLISDLSIILSNTGARAGVVSDMELLIKNVSKDISIKLHPETTFTLPTSGKPLPNHKIYLPINVDDGETISNNVRFISSGNINTDFFLEGNLSLASSLKDPSQPEVGGMKSMNLKHLNGPFLVM